MIERLSSVLMVVSIKPTSTNQSTFRLNQEEGEPMEVLVLKRNFNKEEYLEKEYTI